VSVVPKGVELTRLDRTKWQEDYLVDVGVQKVIANDAEGDGLAKLTDEILDLFTTARLTDYRAGLVKVEPIPYWPDHLKEMNLFTSIQTLTFRVVQ
jgi:hypothetical protein